MESKVSGLLTEAVAPEIQDHIYGPRLERMFVPCFPYLTEINQAHVVMLARCGIITPDIARKLATVLLELARAGPEEFDLDPAREDAYFNYEAKVIEKTGADVGGRMHIGRSRNDLQAALDRMRCRDYCLDILAALNEVRHVALERAATQAHVVMPGYTHLQPAQPITFGYYLLGIAGAFERDFGRIAGAYPRMNLNPLGAGALAGTSFPIDRALTAELLGFSGVLEHGQDAVASRDFAIELLMGCAGLALSWSRLAQDLFVMVSHEFRTLSFPDSVFGTSSMMPQKKNPVVLEHLKGSSGHVIGALTGAMTAIKGTNFTNTVDGNTEALRYCYEVLADTRAALSIVKLVLANAACNEERCRALVEENYSTATDLADLLVREAGLSFRQAHHLTGLVVRRGLERGLKSHQIKSGLIREAARELFDRELEIPDTDLEHCLDPHEAVASRTGIGCPAEPEVRRMIEEARRRLGSAVDETNARRDALGMARERLHAESVSLAGR